jgi:hypothetical protein
MMSNQPQPKPEEQKQAQKQPRSQAEERPSAVRVPDMPDAGEPTNEMDTGIYKPEAGIRTEPQAGQSIDLLA